MATAPEARIQGRGHVCIAQCIAHSGLKKTFDRPAVADLDLTIQAGEFYGLLGPNGAGKTTTLRMVAGLLQPDQGTIEVFGVDARAQPRAAKELIAWLPDEPLLYDKLTVIEYLAFVAGLWRMDPAVAERNARALLERLDLWAHRDERCEGFSRGMKQKAALAGALIHEPRLLILDEPLTGLDAAIAREVKDLLLERAKAGCTIILTTHIMDVAERLVDRVGIIQSGRILAEGTLEELRSRAGRDEATLEDLFLQLVGPARYTTCMNFSQNQFLLLLRNEFRLYVRGGLARGASLVFLIIGQVALHLFALMLAWGSSMRPRPAGTPDEGLIMLSGGLMAMFMLMTSRSLASAVQALYTRGDLDLLLASPVDRRAVTGVRMGAIALTVAMEVALLVWPFANVFVLFGNFAWFKAYLLVPAMAMLATSIGLGLTLLSFRTIGPRRTRIVVQILAVLVGMGIMVAIYLPRILSSGPVGGPGRGGDPWSAGVKSLMTGSGGYRELLVTPAHWVMQGFLPTVAFFVAAAALLALAIHLLGDRIVSAMTAVSGVSVRRSSRSAAASTPQFRHGFRTVIVFKELKLIARDPYLIAQLLQQGLFTLPATFALWRVRAGDMPLAWIALVVLAAGIAGPLSWITLTAEDAPDLLASAPISRAALIRAKIEAAMLPVLPLCLLPLIFLLRTHPWFAICTSLSAMAAALSAALINAGNPVAKRRDSFKQRHKGNGGRGFLEAVSLIFWVLVALGLAWAGKLLAGWR